MGRSSDTRRMRLDQVERCLGSGMRVEEWCRLNNVARSTFYGWLKVYRDESQGRERSNADWIEVTRQEVRDSRALAVGGDAGAAAGPDVPDARADACPAIRVSLNGAGILIPPGCGEAQIGSVLRAVATL